MPLRAERACRNQRCPSGTNHVSGYCDPCRRGRYKEQDRDRGPEHAFYNSTEWKRVRLLQLSRDPLCVACVAEGELTLASHVDHIVPIVLGGDRLNLGNVQSLCTSHHSKKTVAQMRDRGLWGTVAAPAQVRR